MANDVTTHAVIEVLVNGISQEMIPHYLQTLSEEDREIEAQQVTLDNKKSRNAKARAVIQQQCQHPGATKTKVDDRDGSYFKHRCPVCHLAWESDY